MIDNEILDSEWNTLDKIPPDESVEVIDNNGNIAKANPTYYTFKVIPNPNKSGKWTSDIEICDPYWDGGWLIECFNLNYNISGEIVGWRKINNDK